VADGALAVARSGAVRFFIHTFVNLTAGRSVRRVNCREGNLTPGRPAGLVRKTARTCHRIKRLKYR
jgi:hypothetical protein